MTSFPTLLFVDDELNILHMIRRELFDAPFNVLLAESAREGLLIMQNTAIDLVVCDFRMPDMDGIQFLSEVRVKYPGSSRAILSGYLDETMVLSVITKGLVNTFFAKPWDPGQFRQSCIQILNTRKILKDPHLVELVNSLGTLPSLPDIYDHFIKAIEAEAPPRQLAAILEQDTPLATNILHLANAAFFSTYPITSLERALIQLGNNIIKNTVLILSLADTFPWSPEQKKEVKALLTHSSRVSRLTTLFYQQLHLRNMEELNNSAALTHDIGKFLLLYFFPDLYREIVSLISLEPGLSFREAELRLNAHHITHCELGAYFLSSWNLPAPNIEGALYHHSPQAISGSNAHLIHLISLANLGSLLHPQVSCEEWLDLTKEMPLSEHERRQLWANPLFAQVLEHQDGE